MSRKAVDWEAVEREYRAGIRSLRDIGESFGCTEGAIRKKAKTQEWERDLSAKIKAKAEALVRKQEVRKQVREESIISDREQINASAQMLADVVLGQREDVRRSRGVVQKLFAELEFMMDQHGDLKEVAEIVAKNDDGAMEDLLRKITALPVKTDVAKKLSEALRILIELERKVLRIDENPEGDNGSRLELTLAQRASRIASLFAKAAES